MSTTFQRIASRIQGSYMSIFLFLVGVSLMLVGINHFIEDTISSYNGVIMLEQFYGMKPTTYPLTYFTISISPQIAQIGFFYLFIANPKKNWWALVIFGIASGFDFYTDIWYRSNERLWESADIFAITSIMTFMVYTFGSELFISTGFGLTFELLAPAIRQMNKARVELSSAVHSYQIKNTTQNRKQNQNNRKNLPKQENYDRQRFEPFMQQPRNNRR